MEDERLAQIEKAKLEAINQSNDTYNQMHQDNQSLLDQQTNYANEYEKTQNEALDKQLELYKQNIEQQKKTAQENYETESRRAENDYVAYNNPYGYQAEMMASKGQLQSGISQTSQLGSYNAYQNRLATANKTMQDAFTQYDLDMNEAIINNDVQKAQNALAKLEMILGFQQNFYDTKNTITQNQLSNNQALDESYHGRYMDMVNQINTEKELAEKIRQYEEQLAYQKERDKIADEQWQKEYNLSKESVNASITQAKSPVIEDNNPKVTEKPADYYYSNGYQPRYMQNSKGEYIPLKEVGLVGNHFLSSASIAKQSILEANGKYYVWNDKVRDYVDVTKQYTSGMKYYVLSW